MPARQIVPEMDVPVETQHSEPAPLKETAAPAPIAVMRPLAPQPATTVLIHASDVSIRKLLRRLLERRGHAVIETAAGETMDAVSLVVADLTADAPTRVELDAIAEAQPAVKVLLLVSDTGLASTLPERVVMLQKPFALDTFVDTVDRLLK